MSRLNKIEIRKQDGTPVVVKLNGTSLREYAHTIDYSERGDEFFQVVGINYDQIDAWLDTLPTYNRGKLKADIHANRDKTALVISEDLYNRTIEASNAHGVYTSKSHYPVTNSTFECFSLIDAPWIVINRMDSLPNLAGLYNYIETSYCDQRYGSRGFEALRDLSKLFEQFKTFRHQSSWEVSCENTGYEGEQLSVNVKIGGKWVYIVRLMPHEKTYWGRLINAKTKSIVLTGNIVQVLHKQDVKHEKQLVTIKDSYAIYMNRAGK